jgi:adenylate kinase family enzyme
MQQANLARVVVVGTSCSGKTTFARRLAGHLGTRCVELDALYWGHAWTPRSDFEDQVRLVVDEAAWVLDGNYSSVRNMVWRRATAIVWLDYPFRRVFAQAVRRTARRIVTRERLYGGNRETIGRSLLDVDAPLWLVVRTHGRRRREFPQLFDRPEYRHASIIRLQAPAAADMFLSQLGARGQCQDI